MKIVANLDGQRNKLADTLRRKGVRAKVIKRSTLVDLPPLYGKKKGMMFRIPPETEDALMFIDMPESSGVVDGTQYAEVVCGMSGSKLKPYFVSQRRRGTFHRYGRFCVPNALVTVRCQNDKLLIMEHRVEILRKGVARIKSDVMWQGLSNDVPPELHHYKPAVRAACIKAGSERPSKLHFAEW